MQTIQLSRNAPVVLIDASYFSIHRLFATSRWWSMKNKTAEAAGALASLMSNFGSDADGFEEALIKHTEADIQKIQKKWGLIGRGNKAIAPNNLIFCVDCAPSTIWRLDVYGDYKKRYRNGKLEQPSCGQPDCIHAIKYRSHLAIGHPRLEADDVACLIFRQVRAVMGNEHPIVIISGDHDFLQLKDDHTEIYSLPFKNLWEAGIKKGTADIMVKVLMGDPSDDIPRVLTKKQIEAYMGKSPEERDAFLAKLGKTAAYERNKMLMCWSNIPTHLAEEFNRKWEIRNSSS